MLGQLCRPTLGSDVNVVIPLSKPREGETSPIEGIIAFLCPVQLVCSVVNSIAVRGLTRPWKLIFG